MKLKVVFILAMLTVLLGISILPALAQDEFVFGVILVGPKNDGGWSQNHYEAGQRLEQEIPGAKMLLFESLNTADHPETSLEDVVTEMVDQGAKVIFTTSDEFEEDTDTVAKNFPDTVFINVSGSRVLEGLSPSNVGEFDTQLEWTKTISGCAAALATQTGKIGYLGALINYETRRLAAATYLGAKYCWENVRGMDAKDLDFTVTWIGFWFGIPGVTLDPTAEANNFFDNGADVVMSGIDTPEALVVADQRSKEGQKVWGMAQDYVSGCDAAPDVCLGVPYYNWYPGYKSVIDAVKAGTWTQSWQWLKSDWTDINNKDTSAAGFAVGKGLSEEQATQLQGFIDEMAAFAMDEANADAFFLWQGPLNFQDGTVLAAEGENVVPVQKLADGPSIWYLPQLLEGMTGASSTQ